MSESVRESEIESFRVRNKGKGHGGQGLVKEREREREREEISRRWGLYFGWDFQIGVLFGCVW